MPHEWKFAADAKWEDALILDAAAPMNFADVERWVLRQPQNVAFECVFAENGAASRAPEFTRSRATTC